MPAKKTQAWFVPADILRIGLPIAALGLGFYFTTNYRLSESDRNFESINKRFDVLSASIEAVKTKAQEIGKIDDQARSRVRDEFLKAQESTNLALAKLDTRAAVAETRYEQMVTTLNKISDQMASVVRGNQSQTDRRGR